jgi:hypothetical protein
MLQTDSERIQVPQNLKVQYKSWTLQRIGWIIMILIVLAAALGLFGQGILSKTKIFSSSKSLQLEYERFMRFGGRSEMLFNLNTQSPADTIILTLNNTYLDYIQVESVQPEILFNKVDGKVTNYYFLKSELSNQIKFIIHIKPLKTGSVNGQIKANDEILNFTHYIYP